MDGDVTREPAASGGDIDAVWREHRPFLVDLAFRMLGDFGAAEDVVQEAFTRLLRAERDRIEDVRGWLVVVTSRLCLDTLRSARVRRQELGADEHLSLAAPAADPADRVTLDDNIRVALAVVLERLSPPERAVFVLHDVFRFPFDTAASIVGRTPEACRKLASRARRRIRDEAGPARFTVQPAEEQEVIERFIAACAGGDLPALLQLLDPHVAGEVDLGDLGTRPVRHGRDHVAQSLLLFFGAASGATMVSSPLGAPTVLAFRNRELAAILTCDVRDGRIHDIHAIADPRKLALTGLSHPR